MATRNRSGSRICICCRFAHVSHTLAYKGTGNHIGKGCDNEEGKEPAEKHKQLSSCLADILFNDHSHGLSFIFNRGI